jgi:hypothetical protein
MANWTREELQREEVRGIFALGVLAVIVSYWQLYSEIEEHLGASTYGGLTIDGFDYLSDYLLLFWGMYVLLTAVSMTDQRSPAFAAIFATLKNIASTMFWFGSVSTIGIGALISGTLLYCEFLYGSGFPQVVAIATVTAVVVVLIASFVSYLVRRGIGLLRALL